jgi:histidinol-phosphate aminotransferase
MNAIESLARPEILAMRPYESARSSAGVDGILLNANEAPVSLAGNERAASLPLNRYPPPQPADLRERLAALYGVPAEHVLVTRGSDEGIDLLTRVFCRPGQDAVIECPPCFGMYRVAAAIQGADVIAVPRQADSLRIDFERLVTTIGANPNARLVFLTSPNNPTGDLIARENLLRVLDACGDTALLVLDEAYIEFCSSPSAVELIPDHPRLVVLRTLSKAWASAGLRCGSVIAQPPVIGLLRRIMAPYPLSTPAIDAAMAATAPDVQDRQAEMLQDIARCKSRLLELLAQLPWVRAAWPGEANFVLLRVDNAAALVAHCAALGIRIRDFSSQPQLENCVRLSIGTAEEMAALAGALECHGEPA